MSTSEKFKIFHSLMQFLTLVAILIFLYFAVCTNKAHAIKDKPQLNDWVCWVNSIEDNNCGTYGWSKKKNVALEVAVDRCKRYCDTECELDYCEKIK